MVEEDHSTVNLVSITDGTHPWLTIPLQYDPTKVDLCPLRWSPITRTLAYLDGDRLCTWNPTDPPNSLALAEGVNWFGPWWSPDGQFIVVSSSKGTLVVSALNLSVLHTLPGDQIVWWSGSQMCSAQRQNPSQTSKETVETFQMGDKSVRLPAGLSLISASPDGKCLLAQSNYKGENSSDAIFDLLGMDVRSGAVLWVKPAPTEATHNYANPDLVWNERYQIAAESVDAGGGFDLHGFVLKGSKAFELKFAKSANYSWISGPLTWTGSELFAPMTLARIDEQTPNHTIVHFWSELAFVDGETQEIRPVSEGIPFEAAAAGEDYVALLIRSHDGLGIVITPWVRDDNGKITGVTYEASEAQPMAAPPAKVKEAVASFHLSGQQMASVQHRSANY